MTRRVIKPCQDPSEYRTLQLTITIQPNWSEDKASPIGHVSGELPSLAGKTTHGRTQAQAHPAFKASMAFQPYGLP